MNIFILLVVVVDEYDVVTKAANVRTRFCGRSVDEVRVR